MLEIECRVIVNGMWDNFGCVVVEIFYIDKFFI